MSLWKFWFFFIGCCVGVSMIETGVGFRPGWWVGLGQGLVIGMFAIWFSETVE